MWTHEKKKKKEKKRKKRKKKKKEKEKSAILWIFDEFLDFYCVNMHNSSSSSVG